MITIKLDASQREWLAYEMEFAKSITIEQRENDTLIRILNDENDCTAWLSIEN
jgi:hypothetical protein